ncbi:MAG: segregation/condensation protein A [Bacilli bacterium]|nr:segregation/condensation protein A [Bacilli bacterium]
MNYEVKINDFEGPLDLLLHLIKESNVDIYDISIEDVTKQYLDYIKKMEELNLSIASEYLIMAAELIEIKSKMLLPKRKMDEVEEEIDDREDLINRLIEYQKYKEVTSKLKEFRNDRDMFYTKDPSSLNEFKTDNTTIDLQVDFNDLMDAFQKYLERKKLEKPLNTKITKKELSVHERSIKIKNILREKKQVNFTDLFDIMNVPYVVVTFLSILDLVKKNEIILTQSDNFSDISLSMGGE